MKIKSVEFSLVELFYIGVVGLIAYKFCDLTLDATLAFYGTIFIMRSLFEAIENTYKYMRGVK